MIVIQESQTADSRTCDPSTVSRMELLQASQQHIGDVMQGMMFFAGLIGQAAGRHDADKLTDIEGFYANFLEKFAPGHRDWLDRHYQKNRHHLDQTAGVPADVNLIDVLDYITDQVMAGKARNGEVRPIGISLDVLHRAFLNTVQLLADVVVVDMARGSAKTTRPVETGVQAESAAAMRE